MNYLLAILGKFSHPHILILCKDNIHLQIWVSKVFHQPRIVSPNDQFTLGKLHEVIIEFSMPSLLFYYN